LLIIQANVFYYDNNNKKIIKKIKLKNILKKAKEIIVSFNHCI